MSLFFFLVTCRTLCRALLSAPSMLDCCVEGMLPLSGNFFAAIFFLCCGFLWCFLLVPVICYVAPFAGDMSEASGVSLPSLVATGLLLT